MKSALMAFIFTRYNSLYLTLLSLKTNLIRVFRITLLLLRPPGLAAVLQPAMYCALN